MKKIILAYIMIFSVPAIAKSPYVSEKQHEENCRTYMGIANAIMEQKQSGVPLIKALEANDAALKENPDKSMYNIVNLIIRDAYEQPSYSTPSIKEQQLNEFSAKYYLGCMKMYE